MQQSLHRSLRLLCRQQCRRRLYSATATQPKEASRTKTHDDIGSEPSSSRLAQETHDLVNLDKKKVTKKVKAKSTGPLPILDDSPRLGSRTDMYLASLRSESKEPLLEDLLRLQPAGDPLSTDSKGYTTAYRELVDRVCLSFTKKQLQHFARDMGLGLTRTTHGGKKERHKMEYVEAIMEKWGWQNPRDVEKKRKEASEVAVQSEFTHSLVWGVLC